MKINLWQIEHSTNFVMFTKLVMPIQRSWTPHTVTNSLRKQNLLRGVVALRYGGDVDNKVPQLHATQSKPLD